jgi:hypothetical protein
MIPQPIILSPGTLRAIVSMLRDAKPYLAEHGSPEAQELKEQMHLMACRLNNDHLRGHREFSTFTPKEGRA